MLKYYLHKLGQTDNATCRLCKGADETAEHILCTCDAISLKRLLYLGTGKANLTPEEVVSVAPRQLLNYKFCLKHFSIRPSLGGENGVEGKNIKSYE